MPASSAFSEEDSRPGIGGWWEGFPPALSPHRWLLAVVDPALLLQLSAWLTEEGYVALPVSSPEAARAVLDSSAYAGMLIERWPGLAAPRWKAFVRWQRANSPAMPIGVIASRERAREAERTPEGTFEVSTPLHADHLFLELARALHHPLSGEQVRQAQVVAALLAAVRANNHQQLRRLCTPTVTFYPTATGFFASSASPSRGQEAVVAHLEGLRHRYGAVRLEVQAIYPRPRGLAVQYSCWSVQKNRAWEVQTDALLVQVVEDRIQQLGVRRAT